MQITAPTYIHPVVYNDFPILNIWLSLRKEILFKTAFVIKYVEGGGYLFLWSGKNWVFHLRKNLILIFSRNYL